jgi:hypothetical protein
VTVAGKSFGSPTVPVVTGGTPSMPGRSLTVTRGTAYSTETGVTFKTQWQRSTNGSTGPFTAIAGATGATYTPTLGDVGVDIRASVTASRSGYARTTLASDARTISSPDAPDATVSPSIASTSHVGTALIVDVGLWNTSGLTFRYQWFRNDIAIPGATGTVFTPTASSYGDEIRVEVTGSRSGYGTGIVSSNAVTVAAGAAPQTTTVAKITSSGGTYTVSSPAWTVDGLIYSYQWQVAGENAFGAGATSDSFVPSGSQHGVLTVMITATRLGYDLGHATSTGPVLP